MIDLAEEAYRIIRKYCENEISALNRYLDNARRRYQEEYNKTKDYEKREKLKKEFDNDEKYYKAQISETSALKAEAYSLLVSIKMKEKEKAKYAEFFAAGEDTKKYFYELSKESNDEREQKDFKHDARAISRPMYKDKRELNEYLQKDIDYSIKSFKEACKKFGLKRELYVDKKTYTLESLQNRLVNAAEDNYINTYHSSYEDYTPKATRESEHKMHVINQYEKNYEIERVEVERKEPRFFKSKGHKPTRHAVTGKYDLEKMMRTEKIIDSIKHAIHHMDPKVMHRTIDSLYKLEEKYTKKLELETERFNKSDYEAIEAAVNGYNKRKELEREIENYAQLYAKMLEAKKNGDTAKALEYENALYSYHLGENDLYRAQMRGRDILHNKEMDILHRRNQALYEKMQREARYIRESEEAAKIRAEVVHDLAWSNWTPDYTPIIVGGDESPASVAEYERLFYEEVDRRVAEKMNAYRAEERLKEIPTPAPQVQDSLETDLRKAVTEMLDNSFKRYSPADYDRYIEKYKSIAHLPARERAIQMLIYEGHLPKDINLDKLPRYAQEAIEAQMRIEREISEVLDRPRYAEFLKSKEALERAQKAARTAEEDVPEIPTGGPRK